MSLPIELLPVEEDAVRSALDRYAALTDGPQHAAPVARRFARALRDGTGDAALEVGVRAGGMSAIFCHLAGALASRKFMVLSVDPWGCAPYFEGGRDVSGILSYDERFYAIARQLLSRFPNSMLFRLDADTFLGHVLPHLRWWIDHGEFPRARSFLSFAYLDGRHDAMSVVGEVLRVLPFLARRGCIVIDNIDKCIEAREFLTRVGTLNVEAIPGERLIVTLPATDREAGSRDD